MKNLCIECGRKVPSNTSRREAVNEGLTALENYWKTQGEALTAVDNVLRTQGYALPLYGDVDRNGNMNVEVGEGLWLHVSFYRMGSGNWELVSYVNR